MGHETLHGESHEDGNADEINVDDLSGELADPQKQKVQDFIEDAYTYSTSWTTLFTFVFSGTADLGTPTAIKLLLYEGGVGAAATIDARVIDLDNLSAVVGSVTGLSPAT